MYQVELFYDDHGNPYFYVSGLPAIDYMAPKDDTNRLKCEKAESEINALLKGAK